MERLALTKLNNKEYLIPERSTGSFVFDLATANDEVLIRIDNSSNVDLLLLNLKDGNNIQFEIADNVYLNVATLGKNDIKSFKIGANVGYKSTFSAYFADFIHGKVKSDITINLNKEGAKCNWHLASKQKNKDNKEFDVSAYHNAINTYAQLDNYGVCRDEGKLTFSGICKIINGSHGSKAHQNAKIMVFDELSNGVAKPILKIDENDIEASHAAIVGKINDEHIFYLTSRGLSEEEAKRIITLGYLKPILKGFSDDNMVQEIENLIEGEM